MGKDKVAEVINKAMAKIFGGILGVSIVVMVLWFVWWVLGGLHG